MFGSVNIDFFRSLVILMFSWCFETLLWSLCLFVLVICLMRCNSLYFRYLRGMSEFDVTFVFVCLFLFDIETYLIVRVYNR